VGEKRPQRGEDKRVNTTTVSPNNPSPPVAFKEEMRKKKAPSWSQKKKKRPRKEKKIEGPENGIFGQGHNRRH